MAQQVTIPDEWVEFVARRVQEGGYADSGEVVAEALADLVAREDGEWTDGLTERERQELRESIIQLDGEADAEVARGEYVVVDPEGNLDELLGEVRAEWARRQ